MPAVYSRPVLQKKVVFVPGDVFFADNPESNALRLSYSMLTEESADEAGRRLARALQTLSA